MNQELFCVVFAALGAVGLAGCAGATAEDVGADEAAATVARPEDNAYRTNPARALAGQIVVFNKEIPFYYQQEAAVAESKVWNAPNQTRGMKCSARLANAPETWRHIAAGTRQQIFSVEEVGSVDNTYGANRGEVLRSYASLDYGAALATFLSGDRIRVTEAVPSTPGWWKVELLRNPSRPTVGYVHDAWISRIKGDTRRVQFTLADLPDAKSAAEAAGEKKGSVGFQEADFKIVCKWEWDLEPSPFLAGPLADVLAAGGVALEPSAKK